MKLSSSSPFTQCIHAALAHLLIIQAYGQGYYELDGGAETISSTFSFDGESAGDTYIPKPPYFEGSGQRDALLVFGGGSLSLTAGADVSVSNSANHTAFARVGYGTDGTLNITNGASFSVGHAGRYANFHIGHDATGAVNQNGGTASLIGSVNIGANGGHGTYTISGGTFTLDQTADGGTSLLSVGFHNAAPTAGTSTGVFNIDGGSVNILSSHGGSTQFIIGNRTDVALGTSGPSGAGNGTVNQTDGVFHIGTGANLFLSGYGGGVYNLSGGALQIGGGSLRARYGSGAAGAYEFNFSGGAIVVTGSDLVSDVNINISTGTPPGSVIDTNGLNATLSGDLTGAGTLVKVGAGNLNLSGDNHLTNEFYVVGGTVNQTGGDSTVRYLAVGSGAGASGDFNLTGGSLALTTALQIGDFGGTSTFTIDGGAVTVGGLSGASLGVGNQGGNGVLNLESGSLTLGAGLHSLGRMDNRPPETPAGSGTININGGVLEIVNGGSLILGDRISVNGNSTSKDAFGSGTVNQTDGILRVTEGKLFLAGHGATGTGTYNLNGGALEIGGNNLTGRYNNSISTYNFNLGGGTLRVIGSDLTSDVSINVLDNDPTSAVTQSWIDTNGFTATLSGSINGNGALIKTGVGRLNLTGSGTRNFASLSAAEGTVAHQSGATTLDSLFVGAYSTSPAGALDLSGGELNVTGANSAIYIGVGAGANTGTLSITGGTLNVGSSSHPGVRVELYVGAFGTEGTGTVNHSGGVLNKWSDDGTFQIGNQATGIYNLSGTGEVNIYGPNSMVLGRSSASFAGDGTLNVSGGTLNFFEGADMSIGGVQAGEPIGVGTGTVNQTGGTVSMGNGSIVIGQRGSGTYNLFGGILEIGGVNRLRQGSGGNSSFNLGGGTLRVAGSNLTSSLDINVAAGGSAIDTNGLDATLSGSLSGEGALTKTGLGTLHLTGDNSLTTSLHIEGGGVNQTSGDSSINYLAVGTGSGNSGSYTMGGGALEVNQGIQVGDFGASGTFSQTGGSITIGRSAPGSLNIGNQGGNGVYHLSGGSFEIANGFLSLGRSTQATAGTGVLNVSGTAELTIGDLADLIVGDRDGGGANGSGTVNQTGGTVRVQGNGELWVGAHGAGTYNLDGGRLEIGGAALKKNYQASAGSIFNLGGGTIAVTGSKLETDVRLNLIPGRTSTIDTASYGAAVAGFSGAGALYKTGDSELAIATDSTMGDLTVGDGGVTSSAVVTVNDLHMNVNTTFSGVGFLQVQGTFTGTGSVAIDTRITGSLAVGNSSGTMTVASDMTIATGATYEFDLTGNATGSAGTTFDQITLSLGTFAMEDGSTFAIILDDVDFAASFWGMDQSWLVVDGDGTGAVVLGDAILTTSQSHSAYGSFSLGADGDDLTLSWSAIPEPGSAALLVAGLAPWAAYRRRRRD
jgi:fibronectin-binding autotransporter adhesin